MREIFSPKRLCKKELRIDSSSLLNRLVILGTITLYLCEKKSILVVGLQSNHLFSKLTTLSSHVFPCKDNKVTVAVFNYEISIILGEVICRPFFACLIFAVTFLSGGIICCF